MAIQLSIDVRNARLDAIETVLGSAPIMDLRSGAAPASAGAADSGTLLAQFALPADWMAAPASGSKVKAGTWSFVGWRPL